MDPGAEIVAGALCCRRPVDGLVWVGAQSMPATSRCCVRPYECFEALLKRLWRKLPRQPAWSI